MKCDRALLSSYIDNELAAPERQALERHILECAECARALEGYRTARSQLRGVQMVRAPARLTADVEARLRERRRRKELRWLPVALGAPIGMVGLFAVASLVTPRVETPSQLTVTATFPSSGEKRAAPDGAVELWFDRELMPGLAGVAVTVDPPVNVRLSVEGNALRIEPDGVFEPGAQYTVAVETAVDVDGRRLSNPAIVSFVTAPSVATEDPMELGSPRGESLAVRSVDRSTEPGSDSLGIVPDVPVLAGVPATLGGPNVERLAVGTTQTRKWPGSRTAPSASVVEPAPASSAIGEVLGPLLAPYQTVRVVEQAFQGGVMIKLGGSSQTLVLQRNRALWHGYTDITMANVDQDADTSLPPPPGALAPAGAFGSLWRSSPEVRSGLGWAVYEPRVNQAVVQQRDRGIALTLGRMVYLLRADGTWSVVPVTQQAAAAH